MANELVEYLTPKGKVKLTAQDVKRYLISGDPNAVTDKELHMFLMICKYQKLNPFLREAYLIKYSKDQPASLVVGKDVYLKRASRNPRYQGHRTWCNYNEKGELISATAQVFMKGYKVPIEVTVDLEEYIQRKADGSPTRFWKEKPKTMLKKVALSQALREAMPEEFAGTYTPEEMPGAEKVLEKESEEVITLRPEKKEETPIAEEENTIEEISPPPKEKSHPKEPSSLQKQVLDLWKQLGLSRWQKEPIDIVVKKASEKKLRAMAEWAKKKLAEKELKEHKEAQTEKLRQKILELTLRITPTNEELENIGIEDTGISLEDELKRYDYPKLRQIEKKLEAMLKK